MVIRSEMIIITRKKSLNTVEGRQKKNLDNDSVSSDLACNGVQWRRSAKFFWGIKEKVLKVNLEEEWLARWREPVENEKGITQISSMLKEHNESYGSKTFDDKMIW